MKKIRELIVREVLIELDAIVGFELLLKDNANYAYEEFIDIITNDTYSLLEVKSIPHVKMTKLLALIFPDRIPKLHSKITKYILSLKHLRECKKCSSILDESEFRANNSKSDGLNSQCKKCHSSSSAITQPSRQASYKAAKLERIAGWANLEEISKIYYNCPEGYHVDHIVPLQGKLVSGLHVENNLQYLTAEENIRKHNNFIAG